MKILRIIFLGLIPFFLAGYKCSAQGNLVRNDTIAVSLKKTESTRNDNSQKANDNAVQQPEKSGSKEGIRGIKRLKTARPDMSRARGARPPDIERPTGSRIPRGLGKPGGANLPGRK